MYNGKIDMKIMGRCKKSFVAKKFRLADDLWLEKPSNSLFQIVARSKAIALSLGK
jgi:hypothetical protein